MRLLFNLGRKGIVNFIESIFVIVVIFTAFAVLFPGLTFKSKWSDALLILSARDTIIAMDRLNVLYRNSFNSNSLQNFIDTYIPTNKTGLIAWTEVDGALKSSIKVACNCSTNQIFYLNYWMSGLHANGRSISLAFVPTSLDSINPDADVLLIWGNTNLDSYQNRFTEYLNSGGGIVEINNFSGSGQTGTVQQQIFGLIYSGGRTIQNHAYSDHFTRKPINSADIVYGTYKYFYHIPIAVKTFESNSTFPVEKNMEEPVCSTAYHGNFTVNDSAYNFWICNSTEVYFDTDMNSSADVGIAAGQNFNLINVSNNFTLKYINYPSEIGVLFGLNYTFKDFLAIWTSGQGCASGPVYIDQVVPVDNNVARIAINASFTSGPDLPVVILNGTLGRTAWMADFTTSPDFLHGCASVAPAGDDAKFLLASLLMWASTKQQLASSGTDIQHGSLIPYINVKNSDMYEVYQFNLGLKSPFSS